MEGAALAKLLSPKPASLVIGTTSLHVSPEPKERVRNIRSYDVFDIRWSHKMEFMTWTVKSMSLK